MSTGSITLSEHPIQGEPTSAPEDSPIRAEVHHELQSLMQSPTNIAPRTVSSVSSPNPNPSSPPFFSHNVSMNGTVGSSNTSSNTSRVSPVSVPVIISASSAKSTSHNRNAIIGGVVGGVVGLLIITAILIYYLICQSRRGKKHDPAHVTAFEVSLDMSIKPMPQPKLQVGPHPPAPNPDVSATNLPSVSDSNLANSTPIHAQQGIVETTNQSPFDITMPQRDSATDQTMSHPNLSSPEHIRSTLPVISHNTSNLNPLLRDILNATQGRNRGPSDPEDPNVPQNIQIIIINQPSDTNGLVANENREDRGDHYTGPSARNMNVDTLNLPPSYE